MRVRIRFAKFGRLRFLGHLDVMRYMQKAFRRSPLKLSFSEGYHPHPIMSFAQPLSLSLTSDGEYFDVEFDERYEAEYIYEELQATMCEDIAITKVAILPDYIPHQKKVTGMSLIAGATYVLELREGVDEDFSAALERLVATEHFPLMKKTKKGERECDVRAGIHGIWRYDEKLTCLFDDGAFELNEAIAEEGSRHSMHNPGAFRIVVALDAGSENNISTELFIEALCKAGDISYRPLLFYVHRMDLFGCPEEGRMVPLWKMG